MPNKYIDCRGHVMESVDDLFAYVGEPFKTTGRMNPGRILPSLDRFHTARWEERKPRAFDPNVGPERISRRYNRRTEWNIQPPAAQARLARALACFFSASLLP